MWLVSGLNVEIFEWIFLFLFLKMFYDVLCDVNYCVYVYGFASDNWWSVSFVY